MSEVPEVRGRVKEIYKDFEGETCYLKACMRCGADFTTYEPLRELCHDCLP